MTVTVIGEDLSIAREASCVGCGKRLRYHKNDVKSRYDGDGDSSYTITCANCGKPVYVKAWY